MNFAFLLRSQTVSSLKSWAYRLLSDHIAPTAQVASGTNGVCSDHSAPRPVTPLSQPRLQVRRPLRVVRVLESGQPRAHVGRMVISGRMADVCAELDRLAAREAAENCGSRGIAAISC
jgi:hypothetical protein